MPTRPERCRLKERGTATVEFALVLPLLLMVALALVQVGLLARDRLLVEAAARAGARVAAVEDDATAIADAAAAASAGLDPDSLTVAVVRGAALGEPVTVSIGYTSAIRVPLLEWLFGTGVPMEASATDRQEFP
jgi:Flp pilus assembly protein TadG